MLSSMTTRRAPGAQSGRSRPTTPATAAGAPGEASRATAHHHPEFDWAAQLTRLELGEELHEPFFEQAAAWLRELRGPARTERILDVGSGAGAVTAVLAHAFP